MMIKIIPNWKLIPNWRSAWKFMCIHVSSFGALFTAVSQAFIPAASAAAWYPIFRLRIVLGLATLIFIIAIIARLIRQNGVED